MRRLICSLLASIVALPATAQRPPGSQIKSGVAVPSPVSGSAVEVTGFSITPAQPRAGDQVTFQLTFRNVGATVAGVPWFIGLQGGSQMIGQGTIASFAPGASQTVTATWRAVSGAQSALGTVSPPGVTTVNAAPAAARARDLYFTVASVSASPAGTTPLTTAAIDWDRVRVAGGTFADGRAGPCQTSLKPVGADVLASISCLAAGGRMNPVLFDSFALKHGWKVRSFNVVEQVKTCTNGSGWQVTTSPALGSAVPKTQLALWANATCEIRLLVRLSIEGPTGSDPYQ